MNRILITDTCLVPGADGPHREHVDLLIEAGHVAAVEPAGTLQPGADCVHLDGRRRVVIPGFVNAHTHSNESFEQGLYDALPLELWLLHKYPPGAVRPLAEEIHYLRTMLLAIECVRSGITTVQDDLINPAFETSAFDGAAAAYSDLGLRAAVTVSMGDRGLTEPLPWLDEIVPAAALAELNAGAAPDAARHFGLFERHFDRWNGAAAGRIKVILGPIGPQWCSTELLQRARDISAERDLPVHTHTLESRLHAVQAWRAYGCTLIEHLEHLGVLTPRFTLNHAVWLTDDDILRLAANGCSVTHNPCSNLKLGSGIARVPQLLRAGVNVALGTDGTSTSDRADMFRSLGLAAMLHRVGDADYATWPTARDAFAMATVNGARSAGLECGELQPGRPADLVLLDRDDYGFIGFDEPLGKLAFAVGAEAVRSVIVAGECVMLDDRLTRIDENAMRGRIAAAAEDYLERHVRPARAVSARFEPWFREMHLRAAREPVAARTADVRVAGTAATARPSRS